MLFNSYIFIFIFLPLILLGYYGLLAINKHRIAHVFLLICSLWFCSWLNIWYLPVLLGSIIVNYLIARYLEENNGVLLICGLIFNIGLLFFFKYYNFMIESLNDWFKTDIPFIKLILPLGISFYTFSEIAYLYDCYKGKCKKYSLLDYALYVSYFPKLVQGPIAFHEDIISQLNDVERYKPNFENLSKGLYRFSLGLGKKILLADTLAKIADAGFSTASYTNGATALTAVLAYSLQIYFDFSAYTDMAIGVSGMINIELPENFNSPYKATSITDFWDRWHITLTRFFTRYLYIPLGGNRKGTTRTYVNVFIVFLISGIWHGANWTFVVWGVLHGIFMIIERIRKDKGKESRLPQILRQIITFVLVSILWCLFRSDNFEDFKHLVLAIIAFPIGGISIMSQITSSVTGVTEYSLLCKFIPGKIFDIMPGIGIVIFEVIAMAIAFLPQNTTELTEKFRPSVIKGIITVGILVYCILSLSNVTQFIYSNF